MSEDISEDISPYYVSEDTAVTFQKLTSIAKDSGHSCSQCK